MNKLIKGIIVGLIIGLVLGCLAGYFMHNITNTRNFTQGRGNLKIDENTQNEITSFFNSDPNTDAINTYCGQNRMYCAYYCRNINPSHEICSQYPNISRGGNDGISN